MNTYIPLVNEIIRELAVIPAPSHQEELRAEYCLNKLKSFGIETAFIDEAKNVILEFPCEETEDTVVFQAHTDVVFPDTAPLPLTEDEEKIYCPGVFDDTVSVALLLGVIKKLKDEGRKPCKRVVIALNSCEEGLGNLKGTKAIMARYGSVVKAFFTFDGIYSTVGNVSVGSHRYKVTVRTEGGHSFNAFGNENAARVLAEGIRLIYAIPLPPYEGKTTYNVGHISGGTSVNTIVQEASMLCEYRSDNYQSLAYMKEQFSAVFAKMAEFDADIQVDLVGERPCMKGVDPKAQAELTDFCLNIQKKHYGGEVKTRPASTDCNIPHSMGIPAVCVGACMGKGAHTREEYLEKSSIPIGFQIAWDIIGHYFN